jgi:competence protein ComEC
VPLPEIHRSPALKLSIMFAAGIVVGTSVSLPSLVLLIAFSCALAATCCVVFAARRSHGGVTLSVALLTLIAGMSHVSVQIQRIGIPRELMERSLMVEGEVGSWPVSVGQQTRFDLSVDTVKFDSASIPVVAKIAVRLSRSAADSTVMLLQYGARVIIAGRLERPFPARNPGEFSQSAFYFSKGIDALFFASRSSDIHVQRGRGPSWVMRYVVLPVRNHLSTVIDQLIRGEEAEFLRGIVLGDRSGIPWGTREAFSRAGVAHVLAVSGTHVAIVTAFLFFLFEVMRVPRLLKLAVTGAGMMCFMLLTGSQPPVVRATVMGFVILVGMMFRKRMNIYNSIGIAALVLLGLDPRQLYDPGFQLSFGAVISIVYGYPKFNRLIGRLSGGGLWTGSASRILRLAAVSAAALLGTLPITLTTFGRVSIIGIVANIVIVPAIGLAIVLGLLTAILAVVSSALSVLYADLTVILLKGILALVDEVASLPFATIEAGGVTAIDIVLIYLCLLFLSQLASPRVARRLFLALLFVTNIAVLGRCTRSVSTLKIIFIDVGQGDAIVVRFPDDRVVLVDAGPRSDHFDAGKRIVGPLLQREGISAIDLLVATHPHSDHIGGLPWIYDQFKVRKTLECGRGMSSVIYDEYRAGRDAENGTVTIAADGMILRDFPLGRIYVLHPPVRADLSGGEGNLNNESVVIKLQYCSTSVLLEGDAEREAEHRMVQIYGDFLNSSVLKVGHHGSITSTSAEFLQAVRPRFAVASVGRFNTFHHPSLSVLRRLHHAGAVVHRTDTQGALVLESDGTRWSVTRWR